MDGISDWKPEGWSFAGDIRSGRPSVSFVNALGLRVEVTFERDGELASVCFSGHGLNAAGLPHVAKLASEGRQMVSDWVIAYAASRPTAVRAQEKEVRRLKAEVGDKAPSLGLPEGFALADMVEGFTPPARPGRAGHTDTFLASRAREYVERCVVGGEKVGSVARSLDVSQAAFSGQLKAARERGLLSGSPRRGVVDGELTPKAERLLSWPLIEGDDDGQHQTP